MAEPVEQDRKISRAGKAIARWIVPILGKYVLDHVADGQDAELIKAYLHWWFHIHS
jgi:hypothetical protein